MSKTSLRGIYKLYLWNCGSCDTSSRSRGAALHPGRRPRAHRPAGAVAADPPARGGGRARRSSTGPRAASTITDAGLHARRARAADPRRGRRRPRRSSRRSAGSRRGRVTRRRDAHDGAGRHLGRARDLPPAPPRGRAHRPRVLERGACRDAPSRRARPRVPVGDRADREPGLGLQQLVSEELVVVLPRDHPLAAADRAADGRAGRRAVHQLPRRGPAARAADGRRAACRFRRRRSCSSPTRATGSAGSSQRGMGVAILPRSDAEGPGADVAVATAHRARR